MKTKKLLVLFFIILNASIVMAQPDTMAGGVGAAMDTPKSQPEGADGGMNNTMMTLRVDINKMNMDKKEKLNSMANKYQPSRTVWGDVLSGGITSIVDLIGTETINLIKIRSKQKKTWQQMRQKECSFTDSLQSIGGQSDFYAKPSIYGPLDPTNMNFDGITLHAFRNGEDVLKMVCHIDSTRFDHLFCHSKFYLVADTIIFYPHRSFLPNLSANGIREPQIEDNNKGGEPRLMDMADNPSIGSNGKSNPKEEMKEGKPLSPRMIKKQKRMLQEYQNIIKKFDFGGNEKGEVNVTIKIDVSSSWINELVQVSQDVKLGTFTVRIPIKMQDLNRDSAYVYIREEALKHKKDTINIEGDCFVVPRSYMPISAENPMWGTGEYKMKVILSETCQYNPDDNRSKNWLKDYKALMRLQKNGKVLNDYLADMKTTISDNWNTLVKTIVTSSFNFATSGGGGGAPGGGAPASMK